MAKKTKKKTKKLSGAKKAVKKVAKKAVKKSAKKSAKKVKARKPVKKKTSKPAAKKSIRPSAKKANKKPAPVVEKKTTAIMPYLTFPGNCELAFDFYKAVFGGEFGYVGRFKEMPPTDGKTMSESEGEKIMHISLPIGKGSTLMGSDSSDEFGHATVLGNNFSISINAVSEAEADRLYNHLSSGGTQVMPMSKTFWGSYFGMLTDRFGIQWMVSFGDS